MDDNVSRDTYTDGVPTEEGYFFAVTDEETMGVTIEALDADDNVLFTKSFTEVEFKRGYKTTIKGPIFTAGSSTIGFKLNTTEWAEGKTYEFE